MAWRRPGDKSLSEPMMVSLLTHICVTWPQWVKHTCFSSCRALIAHTCECVSICMCMCMFLCVYIGTCMHNVLCVRESHTYFFFNVVKSVQTWSLTSYSCPAMHIFTYVAQFMGCVIRKIHYGFKVVFYFRHCTVFRYHHHARLIASTEHI